MVTRRPRSNPALTVELLAALSVLQEKACVFFDFRVASQHCAHDSVYSSASIES